MFLYKLVNWLFPGTPGEAPYRWTLDWVGQKSKAPTTVKIPKSQSFLRNDASSYTKKMEDSVSRSLEVMNSDGWQIERIIGDDVVYAKDIQDVGKVLKFVGVLNWSPTNLKNQIFEGLESSPEWDPNVKKAKVLHRINPNHYVTHVIVSSAPLVSSRDLVLLRTWRRMDNGFLHSSMTITHPDIPESPQYVRGEQKFCTYSLKAVPGDPNKCLVELLMHVNLKGWLPQYVVDRTLIFGLLTHIHGLRTLASKRKDTQDT